MEGWPIPAQRYEIQSVPRQPPETPPVTLIDGGRDPLWRQGGDAFNELYNESEKLLLVVFVSSSCGPCNRYKPQLKRIIQELGGAALAVEIDIRKERDIAQRANVMGTPVVQIFLKKNLEKVFSGVHQRSDVKDYIKALIRARSTDPV